MRSGKGSVPLVAGLSSQGCSEVLNADGTSPETVEDSFQNLICFWRKFWLRDTSVPRLDELAADKVAGHWRASFPGAEDASWLPCVDEFYKIAQASSGSAGGCDGWCGCELASIPRPALAVFLRLAARWATVGAWPTAC